MEFGSIQGAAGSGVTVSSCTQTGPLSQSDAAANTNVICSLSILTEQSHYEAGNITFEAVALSLTARGTNSTIAGAADGTISAAGYKELTKEPKFVLGILRKDSFGNIKTAGE